ncbi:MAG: molybdopterin oxidoreductase family protein, partial [Planctomycetales bacterium]|nr:molybdopterin oxidoreductase family protein [Planctomycetales bacterium]
MLHGDGNTRQCMATAVTAYKQAFGFDAPPYTYQDFEESDCIVLVGSNLCISHPIMWERVCRNQRNAEIIVVDPRFTETAAAATTHLQIAPKSDQWLFYAAARQLIAEGQLDTEFIAAHTNEFAAFAQFVEPYTLEAAAQETGLTPDQIIRFANAVRPDRRASFWWTMGVNQNYQGTRTAQSLINLALMTGNIGKPGTGANSITGQCNAMGSRLYSNTTNLLGGRDFAAAEDRAEVAALLGIPVDTIPTAGSWPYHRILEEIDTGKIRGLWIICTNPAHSWINQEDAKRLLGKLEFLVVQDMYADTETAQLADLVLPAAGWGEKEGTFINSERRIGLTQRVAAAPGDALSDFSIFRLIAEAWGCGEMFREWTSPEAAFQLLKKLSRGRACDITGIDGYADLLCQGGVQWPCTEPTQQVAQERRLFADGKFYHPDERARFIFDAPTPPPELPDGDYPFQLITGRGTVAQWHTQTRTAHSAVLRTLYPAQLHVEVHPQDAHELGISPGDALKIESRRGSLVAIACVTTSVSRGHVFLPMHYPEVNQLTLSHFDPYSHQPSYKDCAVRIIPDTDEVLS